MFGNLADRRLATFSIQVERHAAAERQRWYDTVSNRRIALMQADAGLYWNDDALLRRALGTVRAEVGEQAERKGWDSALTDAALRQQSSRMLVSAIGAAVERDPERAQSLRTRYASVLEDHDRDALDALLTEAQTRERAAAASAEILNATPPVSEQSTPSWRLRQAETIADPAVRAATIHHLLSAAAAAESRARALAEQVLERVLKGGLTDSSQIPVREWMALDGGRRQAIETRLDHNAAETEPAPNPDLVDKLATEMTQASSEFARRDLVYHVAHLQAPQWQRFRDWQARLRRNDLSTDDEVYAIKRGLQLATKILPADAPDDIATIYRAELVEEIDTWRRINDRSPNDADIVDMLKRRIQPAAFVPSALQPSPYYRIVEPNISPPWPWALEYLFARTYGHHIIPQKIYKSLGVPDETLKVFREASTGPLIKGDHENDTAHRRYSDVVQKVINKWLRRNGIDPKQMTPAQARALVGHVLEHRHPTIRRYHEKLAASRALRASRGVLGLERQ